MTRLRMARPAYAMLALGVLISAAMLWLALRDVDWAQLAQALSGIEPDWVAFGAALVVVSYVVRAIRWRTLLGRANGALPDVIVPMLVGQTVNLLLPVRAGDVLRAVMLDRSTGSGVSRALGSIAAEKVWDWLALTVLVIIAGLITPLPDWFAGPARSVGIVTAVALAGLGIFVAERARVMRWIGRLIALLPLRWQQRMLSMLARLLEGMGSLRRGKPAARALVWSAAVWMLGAANNYAVMRAFGFDSWPAALFLLVVLMLGVALPPSIAGVGVLEALSIVALAVFGVSQEVALAIGLTLHAEALALPFAVSAPFALGRASIWRSRPEREQRHELESDGQARDSTVSVE